MQYVFGKNLVFLIKVFVSGSF